MFETIYAATVTASQFFLMAGLALAAGLVFAWVMSFRVRSAKRFFIVLTLLPFVVASVITFVSGNIGAGVAVGGAFALIRFRSAPGSADEIAAILIAMGAGIAFGMGYVAYGVLMLLGLALLYFLVSLLPIFEHKDPHPELLLRVTIPESLAYRDVFADTFARYLRSVESMGVKTTGMGSMFRLSYKVRLKNPAEEKALLDELRMKNGNLEIALLPVADDAGQQL